MMTLQNRFSPAFALSLARQRIRRDAAEFSSLCQLNSFPQFLREAAVMFWPELFVSITLVTFFFAWLFVGPTSLVFPLAVGANSVQDAFKHNRAKRNVLVAGGLILTCVTLLSCVSSFMIYREGFGDMPKFAQWALSLFAVIVVEGAFIWMLYGFSRAFSSLIERITCLIGIVFLVGVMATNIITHFMMVKSIPLSGFQEAWLSWGAVSVFIAVLVLILVITMADPVAKLTRQDLRIQGKQQSTILDAREEGIESEDVKNALGERAAWEGRLLADQIIGESRQIGYGGSNSAGVQQRPLQANFSNGPRRPMRRVPPPKKS